MSHLEQAPNDNRVDLGGCLQFGTDKVQDIVGNVCEGRDAENVNGGRLGWVGELVSRARKESIAHSDKTAPVRQSWPVRAAELRLNENRETARGEKPVHVTVDTGELTATPQCRGGLPAGEPEEFFDRIKVFRWVAKGVYRRAPVIGGELSERVQSPQEPDRTAKVQTDSIAGVNERRMERVFRSGLVRASSRIWNEVIDA